MPFEKFGYLGKQAIEIENEIYFNNKDIFNYAIELNSYLHQIGSQLTINTSNLHQLVVVASFIRILYGYQSTILLSKKGLISDAKAVLRVVLENIVYLKSCIR
jgi:hypothetical protein